MQLSDLRIWHWMVISVLLGLLIGYSLNAIGPDAMLTGAKAAKTSQTTFEGELVQRPQIAKDGSALPFIDKLVVYPDGPIDLLKMNRLVITDPHSNVGHYEPYFYDAKRPYSPMDYRLRTDVWVKPDFAPDGYTADNHWQRADGVNKMYRDPGEEGARLFLSIAPGNYDIVVNLDDAKQAASLGLKFNGHDLAALTPDPADSHYYRTTIPASDFDAGNGRELALSRKDTPVHILKIHIYNPTFTVRDYLNELKAEKLPDGTLAHPQIAYAYGWWVEPKAVMWMSVGGCFLVIGVIWPILVNLLTGAGFGPPPREKAVSLRNLKATPAPVAGGRMPTDDEMLSVAQMADEMAEDLESDAGLTRPGLASPGSAGPVRVLNAKPVEPPPVPVAKKPDAPKSFAGEYYPVARKATDKKDDES